MGDIRYGMLVPNISDPDILDERKMRMTLVTKREGGKLIYNYDFADDWRHELEEEKILQPEPGIGYPVCLGGENNCPPEDCGGVWGYANFLEAIGDPKHPEHEEFSEWIGGEFDPEEFDLEVVNEMLEGLR